MWELPRENLLVGVGRHLRGVINEDHSLRGDIQSQIFHQTTVMDVMLFIKLYKLLLHRPSAFISFGS